MAVFFRVRVVRGRDDEVERRKTHARVLRDDHERGVAVPPPHRGGGGDSAAAAREHERLVVGTRCLFFATHGVFSFSSRGRFGVPGVVTEGVRVSSIAKRRGHLREIRAEPNLVEARAEGAFPQSVQADVQARGEQTQEFRRGGLRARHRVDASAHASDHLRGAGAEREGAAARAAARVVAGTRAIDGDLFAPRGGKARRERQRSLPDQMHLGVVEPECACEAQTLPLRAERAVAQDQRAGHDVRRVARVPGIAHLVL